MYMTNDHVYGKQYGSGYCYYCTECHAFVGTHRPWPKVALGVLADKHMRELKVECHNIFDKFWRGKPKAKKKRDDLYMWLANKMGIPIQDCHFGYFDRDELRRALKILCTVQHKTMCYDNCGRVYFK